MAMSDTAWWDDFADGDTGSRGRLFAGVAYRDMRTRRIPNELAVAIGALGLVRMILAGDPGAALYTLAAGAAVFAVDCLLFWRGLIGGGDVKLLAASTLLVGYRDLSGCFS